MERHENKKPTGEEVEAQILTVEKQRLGRWYERWGNQPLYYSLLRTSQKLFILLIVLILFNRKVLNVFLDAPMAFIGNRWPLLLAGVVIIFLLHRFAWEKTAVKYYLFSLNDTELKAPAGEGSILSVRLHSGNHPKPISPKPCRFRYQCGSQSFSYRSR